MSGAICSFVPLAILDGSIPTYLSKPQWRAVVRSKIISECDCA